MFWGRGEQEESKQEGRRVHARIQLDTIVDTLVRVDRGPTTSVLKIPGILRSLSRDVARLHIPDAGGLYYEENGTIQILLREGHALYALSGTIVEAYNLTGSRYEYYLRVQFDKPISDEPIIKKYRLEE